MKITIRTDDDMIGNNEDAADPDREEYFANYQLLCEQRIALAYPNADLIWQVSRNTTGVQTAVSVDAEDADALVGDVEDIELDVMATLGAVFESGEWVVAEST